MKTPGWRGRLEDVRLVSRTSADPTVHAGSEGAVSGRVGTNADSGAASGSVNAQRLLRGGHDPRALARLSVEARRAKAQRALDGTADGGGHRPDGEAAGGAGAPTERPGTPELRTRQDAGDSQGDRVEARFWREAEFSSSATGRVQALRELRAIYASRPKQPEPEPAAGERGIPWRSVLELLRELRLDEESHAVTSPEEAFVGDAVRERSEGARPVSIDSVDGNPSPGSETEGSRG